MTARWLRALQKRSSARRQNSRVRRGRRLIWLEGLEERVVLSPTVYTVTSANSGSSGTGLSGTLPYVIGLANSNSNSDGSEIEFDPTVFSAATPPTITLTSTLELSETAGPEVIDGPGATAVTISGANVVGVFLVDNHVTATLDGLTIADGTSPLSDGSGNGGGICNNGALTVDDCTVTQNFAEANGGGIFNTGTLNVIGGTITNNGSYPYGITGGHGGGIYNDGGDVQISGSCNISSNHALYQGGSIWSNGSLKITGGSTLDNNTAPDGDGGGLFESAGTVSISGCSFSGNAVGTGEDAFAGGGIFVSGGTLTLTDSTLTRNLAENSTGGTGSGSASSIANGGANGGGLCNRGGHVHISNCDVSNNSAQGHGGGVANTVGTMVINGSAMSGNTTLNYGGGVYVKGGTVTIESSTLAADTAGKGGGGIADAGSAQLINCTITSNSASFGGGIWTDGLLTAVNDTIADNKISGLQGSGGGLDAAQPSTSAAPTIDNTLVADNAAFNAAGNPVADDIDGTVTGSYNLIGNGGDGTLKATNGNLLGVLDALTGTLANNGGATQTIALLPGSPAIGAGSDDIANVTVPNTDQRGVVRPSDSIDIGAFQDQGFTLTVVNGGSPQSAAVNTAFADALAIHVASPAGDPVAGGVITFTTPSNGSSANLSIETVTIDAAGEAIVTATANGTEGSYDVTASTLGAASAALFALTNTSSGRSLSATITTLTSLTNPSIVGQSVSLTATVGPTNGSGTPTGTVVFTINGKAGSPHALTEVDGKDQATLTIPTPPAGSYTITASYSGNSDFSASTSTTTTQVVNPLATVTLPVPPSSVDGPTVDSVLRYGYHMMATTVELTFDQALDAVTAQDDSNYRIIGPAGKVIAIKSAIYDPATLTVTLHPSQRISIHHTYELVVDGTAPDGLSNTAGLLLDGADAGRPDSDYRTSLTRRTLVLDPPWPRSSHVSKSMTGNLKQKSTQADALNHGIGLFARSFIARY